MKNLPPELIILLVIGVIGVLWNEYLRDEIKKRDKLKIIYDKTHTLVGKFIGWFAPIFVIGSFVAIAILIIVMIIVFIQ